MSFFRSSNKENTLPAPSEPPKRTGKRHTIDWHLNPDPVDGQIRQGTKKERLERDTNHRPVHLVPSLFALIRENCNAYIRSLEPHPKRYYTGVADIVTGATTDGRRFARLEVQKAVNSESAPSAWPLATAIGRSSLRALDGLYFATGKLFLQEPIFHLPSIPVEYDDDEAEVSTVWGDEPSELDDLKRRED